MQFTTRRVIARCQKRHRSVNSAASSMPAGTAVPAGPDPCPIPVNSAIHKTAPIHRWPAQRPRYQMPFKPRGRSWFTLVEGRFALLTEKQLIGNSGLLWFANFQLGTLVYLLA